MSLSISATASAQPVKLSTSVPTATQQTSQTQQLADTVILSQSAQVIQLTLQGRQPAQIALDLGISVSRVNSDLGIAASAGA